MNRIQKAVKLLKDLNADALLLFNESNMHYFCGFSPSEGVVFILQNGDAHHIVDSRYTEAALAHSKETGLCVTEINGDFSEKIGELCKQNGIKTIAFEDKTISLMHYNRYKLAANCEFVGASRQLMNIRNIKEQKELELMERANAIAEKSLAELMNFIKAGKSERELKAYFEYLMLQNGSDGVSFDTILLTGAHTSYPHGVSDDRLIKNGDFVLIDFGATCRGYHSDMTRTFAVGSATQEMRDAYDLVLKAQLAGISALAPDVKCADVYKAAYDVLEEKQMGKYFRHSLGHGLGLDIHEGFTASPKSADTFVEGVVTSIEPGIYIPDKFGIRIEDVLIVTENASKNISTFDKELIVL